MTPNEAVAEAAALALKYEAQIAGPKCSIARSPNLPLINALLDRGLFATRVSQILELEKNERIGPDTLRRHFKRECRCPRD